MANIAKPDIRAEPRSRDLENRTAPLRAGTHIFPGFGGEIFTDQGAGTTNDLWLFNTQTLQWKWIGGDSIVNPLANYGTKGVPALSNNPQSRNGHCLWVDNNGNFWVFGGYFYPNFLNDLWKFMPDSACVCFSSDSNINYTLSSNVLCPGDSTLITFSNNSSISIAPGNSVNWLNSTQATLKPDTTTTYTISGPGPCGLNDNASFTINVINNASVNISANKTTFCPGDTAQICAPSGFSNYYWNTGQTTACIYTQSSGAYFVTVSENGNCSATSNQISINVFVSPQVSISVNSDTLRGYGAISYQWLLNDTVIPGATSSQYIALTPGSYTLQITDSNGCTATSSPQIISALNDVADNYISVYPNPSNGSWLLTVDNRFDWQLS